MRRGLPIQTIKAKELCRQAGVPEGPCGIEEIKQFQAVLPFHQIKVMAVDEPHMIIFAGPPAQHVIQLIKVDGHYHGCTSYGGFMSKSYFCQFCNGGFNEDDYEHHPCEGRKCKSCQRKDCVDFLTAKIQSNNPRPTVPCSACHRNFFGDDCHHSHLLATSTKKSVCCGVKKCLDCCKQVKFSTKRNTKGGRPSNKNKHTCGVVECKNCRKCVDVATHKCYIQPINPKDDKPKLLTSKKGQKKAKRFWLETKYQQRKN